MAMALQSLTCPQRQATDLLLLLLTVALLLQDTVRKLSLPTTAPPLTQLTTVDRPRHTALQLLIPKGPRSAVLIKRPQNHRDTALLLLPLMARQLAEVMVLQAQQTTVLRAQRRLPTTRHRLQVQATAPQDMEERRPRCTTKEVLVTALGHLVMVWVLLAPQAMCHHRQQVIVHILPQHLAMDHQATMLFSRKLRRMAVQLQVTGLRLLETMVRVWLPVTGPRLLQATKMLLLTLQLLTPATNHLLLLTVMVLRIHLEHMDQGTGLQQQKMFKLLRQPMDHLLTLLEQMQLTTPAHTTATEM